MEYEEALRNRSVRKYIKEIAGEEGLKVIQALGGDQMTDEEITEEVEFELNTTRRVLYDLYEARLARYDRSRNEETGWITYTWELTFENLEDSVQEQKEELLENLQDRLEFEQENVFYSCPDRHGKYLFDQAMELNFSCPECGESLEHIDNSDFIEDIEEKIETLEGDLAEA